VVGRQKKQEKKRGGAAVVQLAGEGENATNNTTAPLIVLQSAPFTNFLRSLLYKNSVIFEVILFFLEQTSCVGRGVE